MNTFTKIRFVLALLVFFTLVNCEDDPVITPEVESAATSFYSGDFLQEYFFLNCRITQTTPGYLPTQSSREYGYLSLAAYESVVHGIDPKYSLAGQIDGLHSGDLPLPVEGVEYNWAIACNSACAQIMKRMFDINITVENMDRISIMENENKTKLSNNVPKEVIDRSEDYGLALAEAIYQFSITDGGHQSYLDPFKKGQFEMPDGDKFWVPTGKQQVPLSPFWGEKRSFIPSIVTRSQAIEPVPFSTDKNSEFYAAAMEVYNQVTSLNTAEEVTITKYWADDPFVTCTPTGHTFNIITQLLQENDATLEKTAVGLAMMGVAENDVFICCWDSKFDYNLIRPISYIRKYIDPSFETIIGTPPFPAYTSGHASEIGAGAVILTHLFGDEEGNYEFTDLSQVQFGYTARTFDNFFEMAKECALSRFYGGIHYRFDNIKGAEMGHDVAEMVLNDINWPQDIK